MKLPVLVDCEPYKARLMERSCVDRWRQSQAIEQNAPAGNAAIKAANLTRSLTSCMDCEVGRARSAEAEEGAS